MKWSLINNNNNVVCPCSNPQREDETVRDAVRLSVLGEYRARSHQHNCISESLHNFHETQKYCYKLTWKPYCKNAFIEELKQVKVEVCHFQDRPSANIFKGRIFLAEVILLGRFFSGKVPSYIAGDMFMK